MIGESPTKLLLLLLLLPIFSSSSSFHPQDNYILTFNPSSSSSSSSKPNPTHSISPNSTPHSSTHPFSFSLPLSSTGPHILRLHFNPTTSLSPSLFNVSASQFPLLPLFSPSLPITKEFLFFNLNLPSLLLSFTPSSSSLAFVNAVELFSVPKNLIPGNAILLPDSGSTNADLTGHVLEVLHRVNVGGPSVTPDNDTLWRTWAQDREFFVAAAGNKTGEAVAFSGRINYPEGGATAETAPESVYGTARQLGWLGNSTSDRFNLTWTLPIPSSNHGYLIRLHFCDIVSKALYELYFDVYINEYSAYKDLDLSSQSFSLASPYYIDFIANSNPSGNISIAVGPSARSLPWKVNAILNGIEIMKINGVAKFSQPRNKNHTGVIIGSILGSFVILCCFLVVLSRWWTKRKQKLVSSELMTWAPLTELASTSSPVSILNRSLKIPFSEILFATKNFDEKSLIGSGGFGKVYKGVLRDGTLVAVKRGDGHDSSCGTKQGFTEFQAEILVFSKIRHRHLVSLIGYCDERSEMILVYEFMGNGPLRDHLYGSNKPHLSWKRRLEICIGSARGLHYLHTGTSQGVIIHRDVKSTNILLDESYTAKVADFGLSKSASDHVSENHVSTGVKGSFGYLDPEYFRTQQLTDKSDVYSFGVVLLEVLCARPAVDRSLSWEEVNLAEWGAKWLKKGQIQRIIDAKVKREIDSGSLKKFGETVEKCLAQYGVDRPAMGDVLWNLESVLQLHELELLSRATMGDCSNRPSEAHSSD